MTMTDHETLARQALYHSLEGDHDEAAKLYDQAADAADAACDHAAADELRESAAAHWKQAMQGAS